MADPDVETVEAYLVGVAKAQASASGAPELSFNPHVRELLNRRGERLKPKVRCVLALRDRGAPDGALGVIVERCDLAASAREFWLAAAHPHRASAASAAD